MQAAREVLYPLALCVKSHVSTSVSKLIFISVNKMCIFWDVCNLVCNKERESVHHGFGVQRSRLTVTR